MSFNFIFSRNFSGLNNDDIQNAYTEVYTRFSGIDELWQRLNNDIRLAKINLCYNYLTAWYLCDLYPAKVRDIDADGGKPLSSKTIGGTSVSYTPINGQVGLQELTTNTFGLKAKAMIETSPEALGIYG
jgi:hypothetical protein